MRKIRLAVVIAAALGLNVTGATLWFRPVDGYGWNSPANWLTGAGTAVNRLPQTDDAVLLSSSRIQADTPLVVPGGVTALCQRLTVGENTTMAAIRWLHIAPTALRRDQSDR